MIKELLKFLGVSYVTALVFEMLANVIGDGKLFTHADRIVFFFVWYGILDTALFFVFRFTNLWVAAVFFALLGVALEMAVFNRSNIVVDPIVYGLMAFIPCKMFSDRR